MSQFLGSRQPLKTSKYQINKERNIKIIDKYKINNKTKIF